MWSSFSAVFRKEFLHIIRDPGTLRLAIFLPAMQLLLFGFIDQTVHDVATVVVDQDRSLESRLLIDKLEASKTFAITSITASPEEARREIRTGDARVGIMIPPQFRHKLLRGQQAQILVLIDGSDSTVSSQALATVNGLAAQDNIRRILGSEKPRGIAVQPIILFNPEGRTPNYLIPGMIAVLLYFVAVSLSASTIVREREHGTLEQLLVTPVNALGLMLGKLGPYLFLGLVEMAMVMMLMRFIFDVPIAGSAWLLMGIAVIYLFSLLSMGLLISTRVKTQTEAFQISQMSALPSVFLSGYIFPFEGLPIFLKAVGIILPPTHMIAVMRGVVLRNADLMDLMPHVLTLLGMSVVLVFFATRNVRKAVQ